MQLLSELQVYIDTSRIKSAGRGVFAKVNLRKGQCIERCPVIELSAYDTAAISEGTLISYLYYFGKEKERAVVALGFGSIYNHTSLPNAMFKENHQEQIIEFIAIKDIEKDEEITVNYSGEENYDTPVWFEE